MISVVIPFFNPGDHLGRAIDSVRQASTETPLEIILVDDGSTVPVALPTDCKVLRQENSGPSAARNRGWRSSTHPFVAFLDADDLWLPGSLQVLLSALQKHPEAHIAQGRVRRTVLEACSSGRSRRQASTCDYYTVNLGSALYRRELLDELNGFDEELRFGEDSDFLIRAWHLHRAKVRVPETVLVYQIHSENMTLHAPPDRETVMRLLHRQALRVRKGFPSRKGPGLSDYLEWLDEHKEEEAPCAIK